MPKTVQLTIGTQQHLESGQYVAVVRVGYFATQEEAEHAARLTRIATAKGLQMLDAFKPGNA
ncbi:hypothetical protein GHK68_24385 [Sinorhizobium meliloti]|uniref:hypothetical protein n=1 Tax=Rhizobium meliloti TaxID=382 RepID=UPI0012952675|nr:hypothetical protein [Sinorhizobium meliloti]MQW45312.1 hypothetical protein [Sinorhizobium meliloti]